MRLPTQARCGVLGDGEPPEGARISQVPAVRAADVAHRGQLPPEAALKIPGG